MAASEYKTYIRSRRPEVLFKKGILKSFTKFVSKNLVPESLFNKVPGLKCATLKKDSSTGAFQ